MRAGAGSRAARPARAKAFAWSLQGKCSPRARPAAWRPQGSARSLGPGWAAAYRCLSLGLPARVSSGAPLAATILELDLGELGSLVLSGRDGQASPSGPPPGLRGGPLSMQGNLGPPLDPHPSTHIPAGGAGWGARTGTTGRPPAGRSQRAQTDRVGQVSFACQGRAQSLSSAPHSWP